MIKKHKYKGKWFLPNNPEDIVSGTLSFNGSGNPRLELVGAFQFSGRMPDVDFILGVTTTGEHITLYKCYELYMKKSSGFRSCVLGLLYIIRGGHYTSENEFKFNKISCSFKHIDKWVDKFGFEIKSNHIEHSVNFNFTKPDDFEFEISNSLEGRIYFDYDYSVSDRVSKIDINQYAVLELKTKEALPFFDMMDNLMLFQNFLTLACLDPAHPISINVTNSIKHEKRAGKIIRNTVIYKPGFDYVKEKDGGGIFLFCYTDIEQNFEKIIGNWYKQKVTIDPVTDLLFDNFYTVNKNPENQFLNNIQALETYHRRFKNYNPYPEQEYNEWMNTLVGSVDQKYKEMLQGKLSYGNEPSLRKRLGELITAAMDVDLIKKIIPSKKSFIQSTVESRNYFTHYSESLKENALKGHDLRILSEKLRMLLICTVLLETGFSIGEVNKLFNRCSPYLFQHLMNRKKEKI